MVLKTFVSAKIVGTVIFATVLLVISGTDIYATSDMRHLRSRTKLCLFWFNRILWARVLPDFR